MWPYEHPLKAFDIYKLYPIKKVNEQLIVNPASRCNTQTRSCEIKALAECSRKKYKEKKKNKDDNLPFFFQ